MYLEMPVHSDDPSYEFQTTLEAVPYILRFNYNARMDRWIFDIADQLGNNLIVGMVLLLGIRLNVRFIGSGGPPGEFFILDTEDGKSDPSQDDLGVRFKLIYRESTTVDV